MKGHNPYKLPAGIELDELVQDLLFEKTPNGQTLPYSTDQRAADKVKARLKTLFGHAVITGKTRLSDKPFFARFDTGPSTSTEVIAESVPLAICRLALLIAANRQKPQD